MVVSSALDTSVGLAAGVRLAAALDTLPYACGLATGLLLAEDVITRPLRPVDGVLRTSDAADLVLRDPLPSPSDEAVERLIARAERAIAMSAQEVDA